ncbi:MAG: hypothetical protein H8E15_16130 [Planctomycetes bacterium]|nr:hypothetical protein [Planctomycetota bacterium]
MTSSTPPKLSKKEELERLKRRGPLQRRERVRLVLLTAGLGLAIGVFLYIQNRPLDKDDFRLPGPITEDQAGPVDVVFPPVDIDELAEAKDATASERLVLESLPFSRLLSLSQSLHPGHLDAIGSPTLDFETVEANSKEIRGTPYRLRGDVKDLRIQKRAVDGPEETWTWIRTDEGKDFFYVSLNPPEELFGSDGMYVVVEGFYYKIYSQLIEGEKVTAPLLVGRGLRPSVHKDPPATNLDFALLGRVKDDVFGGRTEIEDAGYWHLLNFVSTLATDEKRYDEEFDNAVHFDKKLLLALAADPAPYRGKALKLYGKPVLEWSEASPENPQRLRFGSHAFLNKYEFGDQFVRIAAPSRDAFKGLGLRHELLGYFLRMWAFEDKEGNQRRTPVFVIAGVRERKIETSMLESQIMQVFLTLFLVFVIGFVYLIRRDKKQAQQAIIELRERRKRFKK